MSAQSLGLTLSGKSGRSILFRDFLLMVPISVYTLTCCICAKAQSPQQCVYAGVPRVLDLLHDRRVAAGDEQRVIDRTIE